LISFVREAVTPPFAILRCSKKFAAFRTEVETEPKRWSRGDTSADFAKASQPRVKLTSARISSDRPYPARLIA